MSSDLPTAGGGTQVRERRVVGVADRVIATNGETLVAYGLGACVGVGLLDESSGVGGLVHTMLPRAPADSTAPDAKFADTGIQQLMREMVDAGANYGSVEGWIAGGAEVFPLEDLGLEAVGNRTSWTAREELAGLDIPIVGEATGGEHGRIVEFDTAAGTAVVRSSDDEETQLMGGE